MKTHAFLVEKFGGPSAMKWRTVELRDPGPGEVLIRHTAIGVNFADTYRRAGTFHALDPLPMGIGLEGAGVIEATGPRVRDFKVGDRVVYAGGAGGGSYAEARLRSVSGLVKIPGWLDDRTAAASISKGCTVQYLFNRTHKLTKDDTILFHAAAGGVGQIACQWAKAVGATMIGTVSTEAKARLARRAGCRHVFVLPKRNANKALADEVMRITKGVGVDVVYDSIGKDLWQASLDSVRQRGLLVAFGFASGPPPPFDVAVEGSRKSIYLHRATTVNYMTSNEIRRQSVAHLFRMMRSGAVKIRIGQTYPLRQAVQAHRDLEARKTTGATVLIP